MSNQKPSSAVPKQELPEFGLTYLPEVGLAYLHSAITVHGLGLGQVTTLGGANAQIPWNKAISLHAGPNGLVIQKGELVAIVPYTNVKVYSLK